MDSRYVLLILSSWFPACQEEPYTGMKPSALACVGAAPVPRAESLCVDGDFVFVANDEGLHVLDRRRTPSQMLVGSVATPDLAPPIKGTACRDGRVFVTDAVGLKIFDATAAPMLRTVGSVVSTNANFNPALVLGDGRAYAASESGFVEVYDVANEATPTLVDAAYYPDPVRMLTHGGSWLAVGFSINQDAIRIVSLANDELAPISTVPIGFPTSMLAVQGHLYVDNPAGGDLAGLKRFRHYDLTTPAAPTFVPVNNVEFPDGGNSNTFVVLDDYLFVANGAEGILAYDIYDPAVVLSDPGTRRPCPQFVPRTLAGAGRTLYVGSENQVDVIE